MIELLLLGMFLGEVARQEMGGETEDLEELESVSLRLESNDGRGEKSVYW
jgi:hypothetical protein